MCIIFLLLVLLASSASFWLLLICVLLCLLLFVLLASSTSFRLLICILGFLGLATLFGFFHFRSFILRLLIAKAKVVIWLWATGCFLGPLVWLPSSSCSFTSATSSASATFLTCFLLFSLLFGCCSSGDTTLTVSSTAGLACWLVCSAWLLFAISFASPSSSSSDSSFSSALQASSSRLFSAASCASSASNFSVEPVPSSCGFPGIVVFSLVSVTGVEGT